MSPNNYDLVGLHHLGHLAWVEAQRVLETLDPDKTLVTGQTARSLHNTLQTGLVAAVEQIVTDFVAAL